MPYYQKLGEIPRKHHIWFHRNGAAPTYKNEGIAYEHVFTTQGFDEAYSIMYHLRPPTRVRKVELIKHWEPKKVADSPLRHHHLKTADIPRRGDLYTSRIPMLFNQDMTAYRARPAKAYDKFEYYKNGGADEIIFVFHGGGVLESVFGKLPYRAEDYIVIPRGITYRLAPDKVDEEDYLILESAGPVRIPQRYLNHEGQIKMGAPYSERDLHAPTELITIDKAEDVDVLVKDGPRFTRVTLAHHPFDASFILRAWQFRIAPRNRERVHHLAPAWHSARSPSGHDHGEQECSAHRGTRRDVRHPTHARVDGGIARARRSEVSGELARLTPPSDVRLHGL